METVIMLLIVLLGVDIAALQRCSETLSYQSLDEEAIEWVPTCTSMRKPVKNNTMTVGARWQRTGGFRICLGIA